MIVNMCDLCTAETFIKLIGDLHVFMSLLAVPAPSDKELKDSSVTKNSFVHSQTQQMLSPEYAANEE